MFYDYVIIGGGAAGLCTAINSKKNNNTVLILDHNDRVGKKILSTGNGRCNLTNDYCKVSCFKSNPENLYPYYTCGNRDFIEKVISSFDCDNTIPWFDSLGLKTFSKNGFVYPVTEQATSVLDILRYKANILEIEIKTNYCINTINKNGNLFYINDNISCKNLILCSGGKAASKTGSDGSGYKIAKSFGHTIIKPLPALCGIKLDGNIFKIMQGVRSDGIIRLTDTKTKELLAQTKGNIQFNSYGISGIPAMNISSIVARNLDSKKELNINIELLPDLGYLDIVNHILNILETIDSNSRKEIPIGYILTGLLNKKISQAFLKEIGLSFDSSIECTLQKFKNSSQYTKSLNCAKHLDNNNIETVFAARIAGLIKHFSANVLSINSFDEAQTTSGGVCTNEINPDTMESKLVSGLFFAGEIIDVDGICGGYNLQWAWSSAMNVGEK